MTTEIMQTETAQVAETGLSPLVQAAMSGQLDTDKLSKLLEIQKDYEANEARKAFHLAISRFKTNDLVLEKDKLVSHETRAGGEKSYRHTTLGAALQVINPLLAKEELSLTWKTSQDLESGGKITVTATLTHSMGHGESTSLTASPEDSGGKNNPQAIASTVSYLERYTAFALCGVASMDQDNDAGGPVDLITAEQADTIRAQIEEHQMTDGFMNWLSGPPIKCQSIEDIRANAYQIVERRIQSAIRAQENAK